jgi:hypothetical protein
MFVLIDRNLVLITICNYNYYASIGYINRRGMKQLRESMNKYKHFENLVCDRMGNREMKDYSINGVGVIG